MWVLVHMCTHMHTHTQLLSSSHLHPGVFTVPKSYRPGEERVCIPYSGPSAKPYLGAAFTLAFLSWLPWEPGGSPVCRWEA